MRLPAFVALLLPTTAIADLSWDFVFEQTEKAEELLEYQPVIEAIAQRERQRQATGKRPAEKEAYAALAEALAKHPAMAGANQVQVDAQRAYQQATVGGNPAKISVAEQSLTKAKAARYQKALTIPELKLAIQSWQQATLETKVTEGDQEEAKAAFDSIQTKLKALSEAIKR